MCSRARNAGTVEFLNASVDAGATCADVHTFFWVRNVGAIFSFTKSCGQCSF